MELQQINLQTLNLVKINLNNKHHLEFLKKLFQTSKDTSMAYLGNLSNVEDKNAFIIENEFSDPIGYLSLSEPIINNLGLTSSSIYYAIDPKYRNKGYATQLLQEVSDYHLKNIDMLILSINKENKASKSVAEKNNFKIIFEDDEDILFAKYTKSKNRNK